MNRWLYPLVAALAASGMAAQAHHSISSVYDSSQQVTIEGRVTEFRFINPHPLLIVEATADSATPQSWQLEMDNRFELAEIGVTPETFKPGDHVVVTGSRGRTQAQSLYVQRLDRPVDGFRYEQLGSRPRINTRRE